MAKQYVKVYVEFLESTLWWGENEQTRLIWITLLVAADWEGIYHGTLPGLAGKARVSLEDAERAIERLMTPDKHSRTPDNDGRRVEKIDGGFKLLNYQKYRDKQTPKQEQDARDQAAARARKKAAVTPDASDATLTNQTVLSLESQSESESRSERNPPSEGKETPASPSPIAKRKRSVWPEDFKPNAAHAVLSQKHRVDLTEQLELCADHWRSNGELKANWDATFSNWLRRAKSFEPRGSQAAQKTQSVFDMLKAKEARK